MNKSLYKNVVTRSGLSARSWSFVAFATRRAALRRLAALMACCLLCGATVAQNGNVAYPENSIDSRLRTDARVDPTTGALQLKLTLGNYSGRGDADLPVVLNYSSKLWRLEHLGTVGGPGPDGMFYPYDSIYGAFYAEDSAAGWTSNLDWFLWPSGESPIQTYDEMGRPADGSGRYTQARMSVRLPDGSKHELRRDDVVWDIFSNFNQAGVYYSVDGSRLRYETATQTLYLPDGSRYVGNTLFIDRHGNRLTYDSQTRSWTDTLGRQFGLPLPDFSTVGEQYAAQARDEYFALPGYNGAARTFTLRWRRLADVRTDPSQPLLSKGDRVSKQTCELVPSLFSSPVQCSWDDDHRLMQTPPFNPVVLHQVVYPDGSAYTFTYNVYGEIDKITYPWGGYEKFAHTGYPTLSAHFNSDQVSTFYMQGNRGVSQRRVSADGTQGGEALWTYTGGTISRVTAPDGTVAERRLHASAGVLVAYGFDDPRAGHAYDERTYAYDGGPMLRRKLTEWQVDGVVQYHGARVMYKTRNPRPLKEVEVLLDTGGNALAATTTYTYDSDQNLTSTNKRAYVEVDQATAQNGAINSFPAGALLRREETDYLTYDPNYRARNLLSLPTATRVKDASGTVVAQTETRYDEPAYAPLPCGATVGWSDPGTGARGNATTTRRWLDTGNTWLEEHAQYDGCGGLRKSWDARGNLSQTDYSAAYQFAYPTQTTSPAPDPTGQYGSATPLVTANAYDFSTGLLTSTTDANNLTTTREYNDPLDRLTQINGPDGGRTTHTYVASHPCGPHVETRTLLDSTGRETSETRFFDPIGRVKRVLRYDPQDAAKPYLTVDTQYDSMGRAWRVSNQYRSESCSAPVNPSGRWHENTYDALGRITRIRTTADNASVTTSYSGNRTTVTDQAGKTRRSATDALGRLTQVIEDPSGLAYATNYTYDALGGLRRIEQGGQLRYFMYDSLGRLTRARNPEQAVNPSLTGTDPVTGNGQWSYSYAYDAEDNLVTKVDPRNVTTSYTYDALDRNTYVAYSDSTPHVKRVYDTAVNGRGLPRGSWTLTAAGTHLTHSATDNYDADGRPLDLRRHFYTNNVAGPAFTTRRTYDLAGNVLTQTYPSERTVSYSYDAAGRLSGFAGNLGDGVQRTYASEVRYHETGGREQERFGTQTPVYNKHFYNVRTQLAEIRVSTHPITSPGNETNWNRGAILNHYSQAVWGGSDQYNNGNVITQQVWIPADDAISGWSLFEQSYTYDALNRLRRVREGDRWQQTFNYDRWGNRTVDAAETWDIDAGWDVPEPQFTADPATNRLQPPAGYSMQYDAAGNLTFDNYTGAGSRTYDAENRMTSAQFVSGQAQTAAYTYDSDGRRVKRNMDAGGEVWQVYGMDGELLAEYAAGAQPAQPQKEYGYRDGDLLVTAEPGSGSSSLLSIGNSGFEAPGVGNGFQYNPTGASWAFSGAGVSGNYSGFTYGNPPAPQGAQVGFIQGGGSFISQQVSGFQAGTPYAISFKAAQRGNCCGAGGQDFDVYLDSTLLGTFRPAGTSYQELTTAGFTTTAGAHTLKFVGRNTSGGDNTAFIDDVKITAAQTVDTVWVEDSLPAGAIAAGNDEGWNWVTSGPAPFSGSAAHQSNVVAGMHQHFFYNASQTLSVGAGEKLFAYVYLDPANVPSEVMLQWNDGSWEHRAYWGANQIGWGVDGTESRRYMGPLPAAGQWVRLEVPAGLVGLEGKTLNGMAFTLYGGRATWDKAGKSYPSPSAGGGVQWLVADHLGTPRMVVDGTGSLSGVRRRDLLPFGEDIPADGERRNAARGYSGDTVRQKFTSKERDAETGLDYFLARYYSARQGRFTSPDEFAGGPDELFDFAEDASDNPTFYAELDNPQSLNKYQYTYNNPVNLVDPDGHCIPCAVVVVIVILTSTETVNAPGPNSPIYPSGDGKAKAILNVAGGAGGGFLLRKATGVVAGRLAAGSGSLGARAKQIHQALPARTQRSTTTAVAKVKGKDGKVTKLVASSEKRLRPAQRAALKKGETPVTGDGHAETTIINHAKANNQRVLSVGASRPICEGCAKAIKEAGAKAASPLKKPKKPSEQ